MNRTEELSKVFQSKRTFFDSGATLSPGFRKEQLKALDKAIRENEREIQDALYTDLKKPETEAYITEIHVALDDIRHILKHLEEWMTPEKRHVPLAIQPSSATLRHKPKGVALIIAPWNYPFMLAINPLAGAIAAGCCAVIKPSEDAPATAQVLEELISQAFDPSFVSVVQGEGSEVVPRLMNEFDFNHIFFTGSTHVGSLVAKMAAEKLVSTTLELGGKSPAVMDGTGSFKTAVRRLLWGKFINGGQSCVAPDYVLIKEGHEEEFVREAREAIEDFYGSDPKQSASFARLINQKRFDAVERLMHSGEVVIGGETDREECYIAPTILNNIAIDSDIMKEEIFGPVLPVLTWKTETDLLETIRRNRYPLACYYFGNDDELKNFILDRVEFGGGSINNTMVQFGMPDLPVGGIQTSGTGHYHGWHSFECFSNAKTIVDSATWIDPAIKYPPYTNGKLTWIKRLLG